MIKHETIEKNIGLMAFFMVIAVSIGGLTQIVPLFFQDVTNTPVEGMKPRSALELEGRDIYIARKVKWSEKAAHWWNWRPSPRTSPWLVPPRR